MSDDRVFAKCAWRLIPFMVLLYLANYPEGERALRCAAASSHALRARRLVRRCDADRLRNHGAAQAHRRLPRPWCLRSMPTATTGVVFPRCRYSCRSVPTRAGTRGLRAIAKAMPAILPAASSRSRNPTPMPARTAIRAKPSRRATHLCKPTTPKWTRPPGRSCRKASCLPMTNNPRSRSSKPKPIPAGC